MDFRERGRARERNINVSNMDRLPPVCVPTRDGTHSLGMRPDLESNRKHLVCGTTLQPVEPPGQGFIEHF